MAAIGEQATPVIATGETSHQGEVRGLIAAALSALIPGAGQMAMGQWRRGLLWLAATIGLLLLVWGATQPKSIFDIARFAVQPRYLVAAFIINMVLGIVRVGGVLDAWMIGHAGGLRPKSMITGLLLLLIVGFTVAPHVVAGYYDLVTWQMLDRVFSSDGAKPPPVDPDTYETTREIHLTGGNATPVASPEDGS